MARSRQVSNLSVKLLLLWTAVADGEVDESERALLSQEFPDDGQKPGTDEMLRALAQSDIDCLELALKTASNMTAEHRLLLLDLAIGMAAADSVIAISEIHVLNLLADAMRLTGKVLRQRFQEATGQTLKEPGDPSSEAWWGAIVEKRDPNIQIDGRRRRRRRTAMNRFEACAILGVDPEATLPEVSAAYDRLRKRIDPDVARELGEDALAEAYRQRDAIKQAYKTLRG